MFPISVINKAAENVRSAAYKGQVYPAIRALVGLYLTAYRHDSTAFDKNDLNRLYGGRFEQSFPFVGSQLHLDINEGVVNINGIGLRVAEGKPFDPVLGEHYRRWNIIVKAESGENHLIASAFDDNIPIGELTKVSERVYSSDVIRVGDNIVIDFNEVDFYITSWEQMAVLLSPLFSGKVYRPVYTTADTVQHQGSLYAPVGLKAVDHTELYGDHTLHTLEDLTEFTSSRLVGEGVLFALGVDDRLSGEVTVTQLFNALQSQAASAVDEPKTQSEYEDTIDKIIDVLMHDVKKVACNIIDGDVNVNTANIRKQLKAHYLAKWKLANK